MVNLILLHKQILQLLLLIITLTATINAEICFKRNYFDGLNLCDGTQTGISRVIKGYNTRNGWSFDPTNIEVESYFEEDISYNETDYWIYCKVNGVRNQACEDNFFTQNLDSLTYNGDENFCTRISCIENSICFCVSGKPHNKWFLKSNGEKIEIIQIEEFEVLVFNNVTSYGFNDQYKDTNSLLYNSNQRKRNGLNENLSNITEEILITQIDKKIVFKFEKNISHTIYVIKDDFNFIKTTNQLAFTLDLPENVFLVSGYLTAKIYNNDKLMYQQQFNIIGETICRLYDCVLCWNAMDNWSCLPLYYKLILSFTMGLMLLMMIFMIPCLANLIFYSIKYLVCSPIFKTMRVSNYCFKMNFIKRFKRYVKNKKEKLVKNFKVEEDDEELEKGSKFYSDDEIPKELLKKQKKNANSNKDIMIFNDNNLNDYEASTFISNNKLYSRNEITELLNQLVKKIQLMLVDYENYYVTLPNRNNPNEIESNILSEKRKYILEDHKLLSDKVRLLNKPSPPQILFFGNRLMSRFNYTLVIMCLICCLIPSSFAQCQTGLTIPTSLTSCVKFNDTFETCNFEMNTLVGLSRPGTYSCLDFVLGNETVANVRILFDYMQDTITLNTLYYTSWFNVYSQSNFRCYKSDSSCESGVCSNFNGANDRTGNGQLSNPLVINQPGQTRCDSGCGCASCGCFYCNNGCVYSGYGINPQGSIYKVSELNQRTHIPGIQFWVKLNTGEELSGWSRFTQNTITTGNFTFTIEGSLQGDYTEFPDTLRKLITNGVITKLGSASALNNPLKGSVGDIQGNSETSLKTPGTRSFIFDQNIISQVTLNDKETRYTSVNPGIDMIHTTSFRDLPVTIGGNEWRLLNGNLNSFVSNPGQLLVNVKTNNNFKIIKKRQIVCPKFEVISSTGCYNCQLGVRITLKAYSTCFSGFVQVIIDDNDITLSTLSLYLNSTEQFYFIQVYTPKSDNDFSLSLKDLDITVTKNVKFTAITEELVNGTGEGKVDNTDSKDEGKKSLGDSFKDFFTKSIPNFFDNIFKGLASWWEYIIFAIVLIVVIVILVFMGKMFFQYTATIRLHKKMGTLSQYYNLNTPEKETLINKNN